MMFQGSLRTVAAVTALVLAPACSGETSYEPKKSNVVLIVIDTLRADGILDPDGAVDTPHIDSLASDGISFENAFSHAPMTLPAHTSLFAAREPVGTGVLNNGQAVREDLPLLPEWLKRSGYTTRAVISLATLKDRPVLLGLSRGFDLYDREFGRLATADQVTERIQRAFEDLPANDPFFFFAHYSDPHEPYNSHGEEDNRATVWFAGEELTEVATSDMDIWTGTVTVPPGEHTIDVKADGRFRTRMLKLGTNALETEWTVSDRLKSTNHAQLTVRNSTDASIETQLDVWVSDSTTIEEKKRRYQREIEYADRFIGVILDDLKARGFYEDSLIVFTSDHGEDFGEFNHVGHVHYLYDPYLHVPLIVKLPAGDPRGPRLESRRGELARHIDLAPTILEILGIPALPDQVGISLFQADRPPLIAQTHKPQARADRLCLRDDRFKMIYTVDDESFELFDLSVDPGEKRNVYEEQASERPNWSTQLVALSKLTAGGSLDTSSLSEAELAELDALGYAAGGE